MRKLKWWVIGIVASSPWIYLTVEVVLHTFRLPHWHP